MNSVFVVGITFVAIGILFMLLGVVSPVPCTGRCFAGTGPNYSQAYFGLPFVVVGFVILIGALLSKNSKN